MSTFHHLVADEIYRQSRWGWAHAFRVISALLPLLIVPACYAQEDCFHGDVHAEPQTIAGFLIRFQHVSASGRPNCRVEVFSLQGGMAFHADDAAIRLLQPAGTDLNGDGVPDLALEGYSGGAHCCWTYWIVSLGPRPGLLATFKNQSPIALVSGNEGKTDIQTRDGAFDYFDCLSHAESPVPTVFLRLEGRRLRDVGMEHLPAYERQIRDARDDLSPARLNQVRAAGNMDELCSGEPRTAMPSVLTIVLAYLYGGQEQQAWKALDAMWPKFDVRRVRAEIVKTRARGILTYTKTAPAKKRH